MFLQHSFLYSTKIILFTNIHTYLSFFLRNFCKLIERHSYFYVFSIVQSPLTFALKKQTYERFFFLQVYDLPTHRASAAFTSKTSEVFKEQHDIAPIFINERVQYVPWGGDNMMPYNIIDLIESDETLSTCQMFNAEVCYGSGLVYGKELATVQVRLEVENFTSDNDLASYFLGV